MMMPPMRIAILSFGLAILCSTAPTPDRLLRAEGASPSGAAPPIARVVSKTLVEHGRFRTDDYDWLRNADDPEVMSYVKAENAYADHRLRPIKPLADEIAAELREREAQEDASVPYLDNGYLYERRFADGAQYPVIVRRKNTLEAPEEIVLDIAALAAGYPYYRVNRWDVSPDGARVAFAVDFTGARRHRLFVRTIATGEVVDQGIADAAASFAFAADSKTLFYVRVEPKTVRSYEVWRRRIDADPASDVLVYAEQDPQFEVFAFLSKSRKFVLIASDQENTGEMRYLPADQPEGAFAVMEPRRVGMRYFANHVGDKFFVRTNLDAPDYRLMTAPQDRPDAANWAELIPHRPGRYLWRVEPFNDFVAIDEEHEGAVTIRVFRLSDMREVAVPLPTAIGVAMTDFMFGGFGGNRDPAAHVLRLRFSAPLQPESTYDFDMTSGTLVLRKRDPAARWFRPDAYGLDRITATAPDGEEVPVTLVYRKDLLRPGGNPTVLLGYGAYGFSSRPIFAAAPFSLIDRGFVYAVAHVRGGHERGERWYAQGRLLNKRNTFTDFIAAGEAVIASGHADRRALFAQGRSAGGLLVGAVANLRPELFAAVVAEVPFVDVITTMSDASVPLTTLEYEEWGNPALKDHYDYMLSYSPYDNIERKAYPAMFVTAALHDSQVSYAEAAKWVARLRAAKTDDRELLFKVDMGAGHNGASGRLGSLNETAEISAWLLAQAALAGQR
jgi:oligopeptidase B